MDFIEEELYFEAVDLANKVAKEAGNHCSVPIERTKCFHVKQYLEEIEDVEFLEVSFGGHLDTMMLGAITKARNEIMICLNRRTMYERRMFTAMHETSHYYFDLPNLCDGMTLNDMIDGQGYSSEDLPREYRANVGASVLMANDTALLHAISFLRSYQELCDYFYMSKAAMQNRLLEYLIYIKKCTRNYAYVLVNDYRYSSGREFKSIIFKN